MKLTGLWRHPDFLRLWTGQTMSAFGSIVGTAAMTFTAILFLRATPFQMGVLNGLRVVPGFLAIPFAGAWADRLPRRTLLITTDFGRAVLLASLPLAAWCSVLRVWHLYLVTLVVSVLSVIFDVAYRSYLPGLVGKSEVVEGNSKLSATAAVAEFGGFSLGGWLVQLLTAPLAILIDAASFVVSSFFLLMIRVPEAPACPQNRVGLHMEIAEGFHLVWTTPLLRVITRVVLIHGLASGVFGALAVFYMSRDLGFGAGVLGLIWAVGGLSSFFGAIFATRLARLFGVGPAMILGLGVFALSEFFIPLAAGPTWSSALLLVAQQLGDGFYVLFEVQQVSLLQTLAPERMLGRVNATIHFVYLGATLLGSLAGGSLGHVFGARAALLSACFLSAIAALVLAASPLRRYVGESPESLQQNNALEHAK